MFFRSGAFSWPHVSSAGLPWKAGIGWAGGGTRTRGGKDAPVGAMVGSVLGLLAFMLAFTFSMAASHSTHAGKWSSRKPTRSGTAYLRARLLPEPQRAEVAKLLREYVDVHMRGVQEGKVAEAVARSEEMHEQLWSRATAAAEKNPGSIMTGLFIQSLNEVIDLHAKQVLIGVRSRIPISIWGGLFVACHWRHGVHGLPGRLGRPDGVRRPCCCLVLAFAGVLFLIGDLDRPYEGLLDDLQARSLYLDMAPWESVVFSPTKGS